MVSLFTAVSTESLGWLHKQLLNAQHSGIVVRLGQSEKLPCLVINSVQAAFYPADPV